VKFHNCFGLVWVFCEFFRHHNQKLAEFRNQIRQGELRLWLDSNLGLEDHTESEVYRYYFEVSHLGEVLLTKFDQIVKGFEFC
jgi:hypothetical protein